MNPANHRIRLAVGVLSLLMATTGFAQDGPRGAALLAEARKAVGGDDRLRAVKTLQAKGDFKRMVGQNTIEGELELLLELPGRLRRNEDLSLPGGGPAIVRTEVLNGTEVWDENSGGGGQFMFRGGGPGGNRAGSGGGGGGVGGTGGGGRDGAGRGGRGPIDPEQLRQLQLRTRQADLARTVLALLLVTGDGAVTWVGTAESPEGRADVLDVTPANGAAMKLFLDTSTHLPLMVTWQGAAPQLFINRRGGGPGAPEAPGDQPPLRPRAQQATLRMTLGEYKAVNGLRLPHLVTRGVNDVTNEEWTVDSYRINPSFKADTFTKK
jgi:hypothetical protein